MTMLNRIVHGDCLVESEHIASGSVDLILTDLPYGTVKSIGAGSGLDHGMIGKTEWDDAIAPKRVFEIVNRILRKNGKVVLFSQEPYTTRLINEAIPNVPFLYRMIWEKDHFANALVAKKAPVSYYEDVLMFSKAHDTEGVHPLRAYFKQVFKYIGLTRKGIIDTIGQRADHTFRTGSTQYGLCTEATYDEIIRIFKIDRMDGYLTYSELRAVDKRFDSVFNLWEGGKFKSNILQYKKDYDGFHPTQKPVLLLEDLIKTFSNGGDTVVDLTAGSGSTCVAAINTGRNFIGIEREWEYCLIANERIEDARKAKETKS